jgi:hypothetical protein
MQMVPFEEGDEKNLYTLGKIPKKVPDFDVIVDVEHVRLWSRCLITVHHTQVYFYLSDGSSRR